MKKAYLLVAAAILISVGAGLFLPGRPAWVEEPGTGLVLSSQGTSHTGAGGKLEIRCEGGKTEVRLYAPIRVLPPAGQASGPPTLALGEEFRDAKGNVIAGAVPGSQPEWAVAGDYARRSDAAAFVNHLMDKEWFYVRSVAFSGDSLTSSLMMFPVRGLSSFAAKMSACGVP